MCWFVDKIFQIMRSMGGDDKKNFSGKVVDNYHPREETLHLVDLMSFCCIVGPQGCSVIMYVSSLF